MGGKQEEGELQGCLSNDPGAEGVGVSGLHIWMPSGWRTILLSQGGGTGEEELAGAAPGDKGLCRHRASG